MRHVADGRLMAFVMCRSSYISERAYHDVIPIDDTLMQVKGSESGHSCDAPVDECGFPAESTKLKALRRPKGLFLLL